MNRMVIIIPTLSLSHATAPAHLAVTTFSNWKMRARTTLLFLTEATFVFLLVKTILKHAISRQLAMHHAQRLSTSSDRAM